MKKYTTHLLIAIILVSTFLRLYRLDTIPPGVNRDEASIGITARSLMTTGKDEYGRMLPLSFESFGDWKLPLYIYTTIPFIQTFGLSELAIRLPSAIAGIASVIAIYFFANLLFASRTIALMSALSLALSPWHMHISRVESEAIVAVLLSITGSLYFVRAVRNISLKHLLVSGILLALTYYTYHGNHVSTSLLILGLFFINWKEVLKIPRWWIAVTTGICIAGTILTITFSADHTKISGISIFGDPTVVHTQIELPRLSHENPNSFMAKLMHNRVTFAIVTISQNYLRSYGPEFLFIKGGGNRAHNIQGYGNLHQIEALLLILGIVLLIKNILSRSNGEKHKESMLIIWWLLLGGVASAITKDAPHSNRMLMVVPALAITAGAGAQLLTSSSSKFWKYIAIAIIFIGYTAGMGYYLDRYFIHFPKNEAASWGYAYKQLTPVIFSPKNATKDIILTHPESSPYAYILFYSGYTMSEYQKQARRYPISRDGYTDVSGFGRFSFRPINWDTDTSLHNTLLITTAEEAPGAMESKIISKIRLPTGDVQFVVIDTDK